MKNALIITRFKERSTSCVVKDKTIQFNHYGPDILEGQDWYWNSKKNFSIEH